MPSRRKDILIVEDEGIIAAEIQDRLQQCGYTVPAIASSGEEALQFARAHPPDMVLMDIHLKGKLDGIETAHALQSEMDVPVVYVTAHSDRDTINRAKLTGPQSYITKPIRDADLLTAVEIALFRHEMELSLRNSEAWLATTLRNICDAVVATTADLRVVFMNPVAEQLTGWSAADALGHSSGDVLAFTDSATGKPIPHGFGPSTQACAAMLTSRSGEQTPVDLRWFENRSDQALIGYIAVFENATQKIQIRDRLIQAQRMEAIGALSGSLAHAFNNQLTIILGYASELHSRLAANDLRDGVAFASEITDAALAANAVTRQLLTISRHDVVNPEPLSINALIADIHPILVHSLLESQSIELDLGPDLGLVFADRAQLRQVFVSLALNARDTMGPGGRLWISTAAAPAPPDPAVPPGRYISIRVRHSAAGSGRPNLTRIFEPVAAAGNTANSLGLAAAHSIVAQNKGFITAHGPDGEGTTFEILLPETAPIGANPVLPRPALEPANGAAQATVLVVEDEAGVRRLMRTYFEHAGYRTLEASNGAEAEQAAAGYPQPIDVLVTDVMMPGLTGTQLAARLAASRPGLRVLFVSGYAEHSLDNQSRLGPHRAFLAKPFTAIDLLQRVETLLAG